MLTAADKTASALFARSVSFFGESLPYALRASAIFLICDTKRGTNLRHIEKMSESDGASLPARYTILSLVITVLNDVNQRSTVMSINDAEIPYKIDSAVSGFPLGRYVKIVTPSWLKTGVTSDADIKSITV